MEQNPSTNNGNNSFAQNTKKRFSPLAISLISTLVVLVIVILGFSIYTINLTNSNKEEVKSLKQDISELESALPTTTATVTPTETNSVIPTSTPTGDESDSIFTTPNGTYIKFQFAYLKNTNLPVVTTNTPNSVIVDTESATKNLNNQVGNLLSVVDVKSETSLKGLTGDNLNQAIAKRFIQSECLPSKMTFEKETLTIFSGKEVYISKNLQNKCTQNGATFDYPLVTYVFKISDKYYGFVQTSYVADYTSATLIVQTLKLI